MNLEDLLAEASVEPPCGPNLEYDAPFLELEQLTQSKPEQQFGDTLIAAEEPQWSAVRDAAIALFPRTKDLRVAVSLARAWLNLDGLPGLRAGLDLIRGLLDRYWEGAHPQLDVDDDNDPTMRVNALAPLVDSETFLRDLRRCTFIRSRSLGQILVRDVEFALGKLSAPADAVPVSVEQIESMARAVASDDAASLELVTESIQSLRNLQSLLNDKLGADRSIDFKPLMNVLSSLASVSSGALAASRPLDAQPGNEADMPSAPGAAASVISGELRSREDAIRMLDRICDYLERNEPSNPAPLLIRRAKKLMTMSFVDIIGDLAPDSLGQVRNIAGIRDE